MDIFQRYNSISIDSVVLKNIFRRIKIDEVLTDNINIFKQMTLSGGQSPEDIAFQKYGDKKFTWIILLANNVYDYFYDWYMPSDTLRQWAEKLYNEQNNQTGMKTEQEIFEELYEANELKQNIKYIDPVFLGQFLIEVNKKLQ